MDGVLLRAIEARLDQDDALSDGQKLLVLAACEGAAELERELELGPPAENRVERGRPPPAPPEPAGAWLRSIAVRGFRGVGPAATLELEPGPGLTLVIGRNGSGKSSFAEAAEVLFTGQNRRWSDRAAVWKEGWRNLHHEGPATIEAELIVEGDARRVIARRTWSEGAAIDGGVAEVCRSGGTPEPLAALGWELPLQSYRPFLSYNELGSMLDEGPSRLFDAMSLILGLEDMVAAGRGLAGERKTREAAHKHLKERVGPLLDHLAALDDDRARRCRTALSGAAWDLDAVAQVLVAPADRQMGEGRLELLQQLAALQAPATIEWVDAIIRALRDAATHVAALAGSDAAVAREDASLLEAALAFHARHAADDCPVCGTPSALDHGWAERSRVRARDLRVRAREADEAHRREGEVRTRAWRVLWPTPHCLERAAEVGIDASTAIERWTRWSAPADREDVEAIASHIESTFLDLHDAVERVRLAALAQLERRELAWRPFARSLESWLGDARADAVGSAQASDLKVAERWLKEAAADVRDERFRPIADEARRIWGELRARSSVDLLRVALGGTGNRRRVELDVRVDGVEGAALGVMSQGELHSLALSLFLPRATSPESPFRFVLIDDPVQSMDPSRVDGLARVLDEVARRRQVVVFTHDDRLPSAMRDLEIDARVIEVTRRATSVVELRQARDPVARQLDDARALAATDNLPVTVARRLVPGFCRGALEAACVESIRRRWFKDGRAHDEVEAALSRATTLTRMAALCLFGDETRGGDVLPAVNRRFTSEAADVYQWCNRGSHEGHAGDLQALVDGAATLAARLRSVQ